MTKTKKLRKQNNIGGKVLASGGYGCVFAPALKCQNTKRRDTHKISKLMTEKHAVQEYQEIQKIRKKLDGIPNYKQYFLVYDAALCRPDKLTDSDLTAFSEKCTALPKDHITKANVNSKLNEVMMLNLPNGGLPVDDYVFSNGDYYKLYRTHQSLVQLLKKGILPMNRKNIYHSDIKDSNVLIEDHDNGHLTTRLIDWGLTVAYNPSEPNFPKNWRNRPLQFNVPFSVILFTDLFDKNYSAYLKEGGDLTHAKLRPFVISYFNEWIKERGAGHYKFINEIMFLLYNHSLTSMSETAKPPIVETEITMPYIIDYIVDVLVHYTRFKKDGTFSLRDYLNQVYVKIVDIWGFITAYYPMLEMFSDNYFSLNANEMRIFNQIRHLYSEYVYNPRHTPIPLDALFRDLDMLGELLKKESRHKPKTRYVTTDAPRDLASGFKTRKLHNHSSSSIFKRRKMVKRFKRPFLLELK
ncbi:MAG: hypothetical protein ACOVRN_19695 [Flavobacterium sp.]